MSLIGDILPLAIGVAISPVPIIAIILMLLSKRAKSDSLAFVLGWIVGLSVVGGIVLFIGETQGLSVSTGSSVATSVIRFALGLLLLFLAYRNWKKRPKPGQQPTMPKWLQSIESVTPLSALGFAVLLSAVNPKNLMLTLAAALAIAESTLGSAQSVVALALFVVIASISVAALVILFLVLGKRAEQMLDELRAWLTQNNATVMFVLLLVFGTVLIAEGINGMI